MRFTLILILLGSLIATFQNCSSSSNDPGFFVQNSLGSSSADDLGALDCYGDLCVAPEEMLWLAIRESNPYVINLFYHTAGHFTVGGLCGVGPFGQHTIAWDLKESFSQAQVGSGTADNACINGRFTVPILASLTDGRRYELTLELVGFGEGNIPISNPLPNSISRVDVVTINQELVPPVDPNDPNNVNGTGSIVTM